MQQLQQPSVRNSSNNNETLGKFAFGKRLIGTGAGGRKIAGLGTLKDGGSNVMSAGKRHNQT